MLVMHTSESNSVYFSEHSILDSSTTKWISFDAHHNATTDKVELAASSSYGLASSPITIKWDKTLIKN